ncbi:MAG: hypothetical protein IPO90_12210 [Flavobacteriales bacterium]|nr:hypothetical protein [Flavobacteriales bacterium]
MEKWGVPSFSITELEWWQQVDVGASPGQGAGVKLTFTPARHFTGRSMTNRFSTLWGSFVLQGRNKRIYFGADSGYSPTFKEIGERFGPFDLALLECGAYSEYWPEIHMFPEETAQAALDVRATVLMPIHWGKFALGLHPWKESIERGTLIFSVDTPWQLLHSPEVMRPCIRLVWPFADVTEGYSPAPSPGSFEV